MIWTVLPVLLGFVIASDAAESGIIKLQLRAYSQKVPVDAQSVLDFLVPSGSGDHVPTSTIMFKDLPTWIKRNGSSLIANPPNSLQSRTPICTKFADINGTIHYESVYLITTAKPQPEATTPPERPNLQPPKQPANQKAAVATEVPIKSGEEVIHLQLKPQPEYQHEIASSYSISGNKIGVIMLMDKSSFLVTNVIKRQRKMIYQGPHENQEESKDSTATVNVSADQTKTIGESNQTVGYECSEQAFLRSIGNSSDCRHVEWDLINAEGALTAEKKKLTKTEKQISQIEYQLQNLTSTKAKLEKQLPTLQENISKPQPLAADQKLESLKANLAIAQSAKKAIELSRDEPAASLSQNQSQHDALNDALKQLRANFSDAQAATLAAQSDANSYKSQQAAIHEAIRKNNRRIAYASTAAGFNAAWEQRRLLLSKSNNVVIKLSRTKQTLRSSQQAVFYIQQALTYLEGKLSQTDHNIAELQKSVNDYNTKLQQAELEVSSLTNLIASLEAVKKPELQEGFVITSPSKPQSSKEEELKKVTHTIETQQAKLTELKQQITSSKKSVEAAETTLKVTKEKMQTCEGK